MNGGNYLFVFLKKKYLTWKSMFRMSEFIKGAPQYFNKNSIFECQ
jgi:hypothetical protein